MDKNLKENLHVLKIYIKKNNKAIKATPEFNSVEKLKRYFQVIFINGRNLFLQALKDIFQTGTIKKSIDKTEFKKDKSNLFNKYSLEYLPIILCLIPLMGSSQVRTKELKAYSSKHLITYQTKNSSEGKAKNKKGTQPANYILDSTYNWAYKASGNLNWSTKLYYKYDKQFNLIHDSLYSYDTINNNWRIGNKKDYNYDANSNLIIESFLIWNKNLGQWVGSSKNEYGYDSCGFKNLDIKCGWNDNTMKWLNMTKYEFINDKTGKQFTCTRSYWNDASKHWDLSDKTEYSYYPGGKLKSELLQTWIDVSTKWKFVYKKEYITDKNENDSLSTELKWDDINNLWIYLFKTESVYNISTNDSISITYSWDSNSKNWTPYEKKITTFNRNNIDICNEIYWWDNDSERWTGELKTETNYDANKNKTLLIQYNWEGTLNKWIESTKYIYTYTPEAKPFKYLGYQYDTKLNCWTYIQNSNFEYDTYDNETVKIDSILEFSTKNWKVAKTFNYYSSHTNSLLTHSKNNNICIYPNPVSKILNIEIPANNRYIVQIINTGWQLINEYEFSKGANIIDVSTLKSGIYFISITTPQGTVTNKFIKK